jgi:hypothetical protein
MKYDHQKIINKLALELANYLIDDKEREDYEDHCSENDLQKDDFLGNASLQGGHVYARALSLIFHAEQLDQQNAEEKG